MDTKEITQDDLREIARDEFHKAAAIMVSYQVATYFNRQRMSVLLGVSPAYLDKLVKLGAPCTEIDGHRMYQRAAFTKWLETYQH